MMEEQLSFEEIFNRKFNSIISENNSIFKDFEEIDSHDYLEEIKKIKKNIDNRKSELNIEFASDFHIEKLQLELVLLQQVQMLLILENEFGLIQGKKSNNRDSKSNLVAVTYLMHQMNNNLVAFYKLLSDGFSFQANLIFRSLQEQGSTIFAILLDDQFLKEYKRNGDIQDPKEKLKHWQNKLSPSKIKEILKRGYSEIEILQDFKEDIFEFNKYLYQDSSEFVHSQFLPSLLSSYSSKKGNEDYLNSNLIGRIDSNIERVCIRAFPYFHVFFDNFIRILIARFDYRFSDSNKHEGIKLWLIHKLTNELGKEYIASKL